MRFSHLMRFCAVLVIPALLGNDLALAAQKPLDAPAVKAKIEARGLGNGLRIVEADKTQVTGVIVSIGEQSVVLRQKSGQLPVEIPYAQVSEVHNSNHLSTGAKVGIWVGVAAAVLGIVTIVLVHEFHSSFPKTIPV